MAMDWAERLERLEQQRTSVDLLIRTLGTFEAEVEGTTIKGKQWGREKTVQLLQFLITHRSRNALRKEQIIDRLWYDLTDEEGNRDFKVALHGIHKILEPNRKARTDPRYISREGVSYHLNEAELWLDVNELEACVIIGNESYASRPEIAIEAFRRALILEKGSFLPNQIYQDWTSEERERLQVIVLSAYISLAELMMNEMPLETVRLTQKALSIDATWEDAYQLQMKAFLLRGNRPAAIDTYERCVQTLDKEFGLDPLPETQKIYDSIN